MRAHLRALEQRRALYAYALTNDAPLPHNYAWPEHRTRTDHGLRMKHHIAANLICERAQQTRSCADGSWPARDQQARPARE